MATATEGPDQGAESRAEAYRAWLMEGSDVGATDEQIETARRAGIDARNKRMTLTLPRTPLGLESRAQSVGTGSEGGFTVGDEAIRAIEEGLKAFGGMRSVAQIIRTTTGGDLPWPTFDDTSQTGEIVDENTAQNEQDVTFDQLILGAFKYGSKMIRVPVELLQDASVNIPQLLGRALGTRIGRIQNTHFTTGDGNAKPRGLVTAADGNTQVQATLGALTYGELVDLKHGVDPAYRMRARWMFNDQTSAVLEKLEDDNGRPLWVPGLTSGAPDRLLGFPIVVNQDMPDIDTADATSVLFGDLASYKVRETREINLLRLDERFAELHQVAFLAFSRADGDYIGDKFDNEPVVAFVNAAA